MREVMGQEESNPRQTTGRKAYTDRMLGVREEEEVGNAQGSEARKGGG